MHLARAVLATAVLAVSPVLSAAPCAGFNDVSDSDPFCVYVDWMKNRGITLGLTPTQYDPAGYVTRMQMAAFMFRLGYQNALLQGGNAFGASARLGTTDQEDLELIAKNTRVAFFGAAHPYSVVLGTSHTLGTGVGSQGMTIGGGHANVAAKGYGTVGGGNGNVAGYAAMVPGGFGNHANGDLSFAAGHNAKANHNRCFVWGASGADTSCFAANEVVMSGLGGFYFWTAGSNDNTYSGARLAPGTGAWAAYSDRNGKERVDLVDAGDVLQKLIAMPIATWQWKAESGGVRHMGPMAQDFHASFGLGSRDTEIVTIDADGVALAAIQGLNAKLEAKLAERDAEVALMRTELRSLRTEVAELRSLRSELAAIRSALSPVAVSARR